MKAYAVAKGRWVEILFGLSIVDQKLLRGKHIACPFCKAGKDRFRFNPKSEDGLWICNQCGGGNGFALLMKLNGWDFAKAACEVERFLHERPAVVKPQRPQPSDLLPKLRGMWDSARPIGDLVKGYLFSRGIEVHPTCCVRETDAEMISMITDTKGEFAQIHRTFLSLPFNVPSNSWNARRLFGKGVTIPDGSAVRLMRRERGSVLGIAEGIETSLSAAELFNVSVWATLTAGLMRKWTPPKDVSEVIIFADNDANYTGQSAAYALASTLSVKGVDVRIEMPERVGEDWNDVLRREKSLVKDRLSA